MRNLRRNPQSSFARRNDNSLIFGTGDGYSSRNGMTTSPSMFDWGDEGRLW